MVQVEARAGPRPATCIRGGGLSNTPPYPPSHARVACRRGPCGALRPAGFGPTLRRPNTAGQWGPCGGDNPLARRPTGPPPPPPPPPPRALALRLWLRGGSSQLRAAAPASALPAPPVHPPPPLPSPSRWKTSLRRAATPPLQGGDAGAVGEQPLRMGMVGWRGRGRRGDCISARM
jgi:hypothetical protein